MSTPGTLTEPARRETRLPVVLTVRAFVHESDNSGSLACTYEISRHGVRLARLDGVEVVDQPVWLKRQERKARYRVSWIGAPGTPLEDQIGLELEDGVLIWDDAIIQNLA